LEPESSAKKSWLGHSELRFFFAVLELARKLPGVSEGLGHHTGRHVAASFALPEVRTLASSVNKADDASRSWHPGAPEF